MKVKVKVTVEVLEFERERFRSDNLPRWFPVYIPLIVIVQLFIELFPSQVLKDTDYNTGHSVLFVY